MDSDTSRTLGYLAVVVASALAVLYLVGKGDPEPDVQVTSKSSRSTRWVRFLHKTASSEVDMEEVVREEVEYTVGLLQWAEKGTHAS